ncbi:4-hydroxy-tetrahydrodipicolinate synthase [Dyadobacter sp. BE34]|uniref:4-hydroxy-tetrahydrodipicolinate synthase n=1 Tax=Dyadobacter fermentans TaxID=94254 RepID=A0ABU1QSI5_9BACT|nr:MULTISPECIES: 4-hydroxy-tetrahydrodipicolinate synthase [Dyadobacter]MDR6804117.1 4-hydroxy-tetrahydrodipicolinate synthase [Dyadobacter fermentans]MDR7041857.1 4-hydroxy-tetrahydrodipicolinate synthase [Dyadobacter sp. BE242]MDR7196260.1 4-hydroxy-tetrahydrodipicolinate synthase [Dyadobacter sp. BE34]MDR7213195.1 4-hydroxy-tetrahydrodipicolinate synthase [Dyadobacter sp. BE31]MDR7261666.1 4-hydroxy-tetrahydrodipicolinate synthase [Dyadobacter sp. BE32]
MPLDQRFKGVGAALITPFDEQNEIDYPGLKRLIDLVTEGGTDYLVVQGTTGESPTVTSKEKRDILAFTIKNNYKKLPIVYGIGSNNTQEVLNTIKETDFTGVDAILSVCPYYNKPTQEGIIAHFTAIADASPVPVLLYNVPGRTVINMKADTIIKLAAHPNIIGIKDAGGSIEQSMELAARAPEDFLLLSGDDNLVTTMASVGWHGVISVIANAFPKEFHDLTWAALEGRFKDAAKLQLAFLEFDTLLYIESNPVGIKKCLEIKGICSSDVRLPLLKASKELGEKLEKAMVREGFI